MIPGVASIACPKGGWGTWVSHLRPTLEIRRPKQDPAGTPSGLGELPVQRSWCLAKRQRLTAGFRNDTPPVFAFQRNGTPRIPPGSAMNREISQVRLNPEEADSFPTFSVS